MMRGWSLCLVLAGLGCATALPPVEVTTRVDPDTDFSVFRTFAQADPPWEHPVVGARVHREIDREFESKGYRMVPLDEADLVIVFRARGVRATRQQRVPDPDTFYYYRLERYIEGTLEIDVFHSGQEKRVWQGVGMVDVHSESQAEEAAAWTVVEILSTFPRQRDEPASGL
jgi:hypothetical protein